MQHCWPGSRNAIRTAQHQSHLHGVHTLPVQARGRGITGNLQFPCVFPLHDVGRAGILRLQPEKKLQAFHPVNQGCRYPVVGARVCAVQAWFPRAAARKVKEVDRMRRGTRAPAKG